MYLRWLRPLSPMSQLPPAEARSGELPATLRRLTRERAAWRLFANLAPPNCEQQGFTDALSRPSGQGSLLQGVAVFWLTCAEDLPPTAGSRSSLLPLPAPAQPFFPSCARRSRDS